MQEAQRVHCENGLSEEMYCAYINNNMRCYNESTEFAETMEDSLEEAYKVCQLIQIFSLRKNWKPFFSGLAFL